jgi:hypothetical protein
MLGLLHLRGHGLCAVLTTKLRPEKHIATIRNKHDPNTHWLEKTFLSSHHDAIVRCYHQRQIHIAAMPPWRVSVSHRLQRDCQTSRTIGKRCPTFLHDSHGCNIYNFGYACWQQLQRKICEGCAASVSSLRSDPYVSSIAIST